MKKKKKSQRNNGTRCTHKGRMRPATAGQAPSRPHRTSLVDARARPVASTWAQHMRQSKAMPTSPWGESNVAALPTTRPTYASALCTSCMVPPGPLLPLEWFSNNAPAPPSECSLRASCRHPVSESAIPPECNRANRRTRPELPLYRPSTYWPRTRRVNRHAPHRVVPLSRDGFRRKQ